MDFTEDFKLEIIDKKAVRKRTLKINRVPYKVFIINQAVEKEIRNVQSMAKRENEIIAEIKELRLDHPENYRIDIKELKTEHKEIVQDAMAVKDSGFFRMRFEAIKLILLSNGIDEDDELMQEKTWTEKMDYSVPMSLLKVATEKDLKKLRAAAKTKV